MTGRKLYHSKTVHMVTYNGTLACGADTQGVGRKTTYATIEEPNCKRCLKGMSAS
jgi:hypothetical protein